MIGQFKTNSHFMWFKLAGAYFDIEMMTLVGDFQDFRPGKTIDAQSKGNKMG